MFEGVNEIPIFTNCLYEKVLDFDNVSLEEHIRSLPQQNHKRSSSGWQSDFYVDEYDSVITKQLLCDTIRPLTKGIATQVWGYAIQNYSFEYWFNVNGQGDYNNQHTHSEAIVSGVYYVTVPENSGNIVFMRAQTEFDSISRLVTVNDSPVVNCSHYRVAQVGKLVLFPGYIPHYVEQNKSTEDRISISFNLMRA